MRIEDISGLNDEYKNWRKYSGEVKHIKGRIGTLELDVDACGRGKITFDGKALALANLTISLVAGQMAEVKATILPLEAH